MQLRKNLNLYLSGIVVFTLTLLLLSTAFVLDESLGNRVAKIFWFLQSHYRGRYSLHPAGMDTSFSFFAARPAGSSVRGLHPL